jgi:hypothetical protein
MRIHFNAAEACVRSALIVLAFGVIAGCSAAKMSEEMAQQRDEMTRETAEWRTELAAWENEHTQMKQWHASNPPATKSTEARQELDEHTAKLAEHETKAGEFARDLEKHEANLMAQSQRPENEQITEHAALWTEHMRLKAAYELLENAHNDLMKKHAEFAGSPDSVPPPNM